MLSTTFISNNFSFIFSGIFRQKKKTCLNSATNLTTFVSFNGGRTSNSFDDPDACEVILYTLYIDQKNFKVKTSLTTNEIMNYYKIYYMIYYIHSVVYKWFY